MVRFRFEVSVRVRVRIWVRVHGSWLGLEVSVSKDTFWNTTILSNKTRCYGGGGGGHGGGAGMG